MHHEDKKDLNSIKITLIGDSGVGKTCIIGRFTSDQFDENSLSTEGVSYSKIEYYYENKILNLDLWDTAGQEKYRSLGKHFYKDSFIVLLVYDVTLRQSFENLKKIWLEDITNFGEEYKVLAIVGNKCDLYEKEVVSEEEARQFAKENDAIYMNVSAKKGTNIKELFNACFQKYLDPNFQVNIKELKKKMEDSYVIKNKKKKDDKKKEKERKGCC
jgi:small GTP-binding protein